jgi:para-nitrobenzyl esterase
MQIADCKRSRNAKDYDMKLKLTILGLCFLTTNGQWASAHAQPTGAAATTGSAVAAMGVGTAAPQTPPVVRVDGGQLQGVVDDGVVSYKGVPFAAPPVGDLRWRPPQPAARWTGMRQATEFGADCMQGRFGQPPAPGAPPARVPSEDCLFLNIWRPASAAPGAKLPVMFWIYGGGFVGGSSALPNTSGTQFAKHGVVLVAANYRVGRFGFFAFPALSRERPDELKGNHAYMDQIAALKWVQQNIAAFGGDPNNVTIFGFSAGGVSVHSLLTSPIARDLFQKAIVESGGSRDSVLTARPLSKDGADPNYPVSAETIGLQFAHSIGIEGTDQAALAKLRALSAEEVLRGAPAQPGGSAPSYETHQSLTAS